jgi:hypothetical protein
MDALGRGIIAGFLATLVLSVALDPLATLARGADVLPPTFGWLLHFFVGSFIWGGAFALLHPYLRGPLWVRGICFGLAAWLVVMLAVMPLTRAGLFGWALGFVTPIAMLVVHLSYGALLGVIFGLLEPEEEETPRNRRNGNGRPHAREIPAPHHQLRPLPR